MKISTNHLSRSTTLGRVSGSSMTADMTTGKLGAPVRTEMANMEHLKCYGATADVRNHGTRNLFYEITLMVV